MDKYNRFFGRISEATSFKIYAFATSDGEIKAEASNGNVVSENE